MGILELGKPKIDYEALAKWMGDGMFILLFMLSTPPLPIN